MLDDEKIRVTLDTKTFKVKPTPEDVQLIQTRLRDVSSIRELSVDELLNYISSGCTICAAVMNGGVNKDNWIEQKLFAIDVDNNREGEFVKPDEIIELLNGVNIPPFAYYPSFNDSIAKRKFRLLFKTPEPITDVKQAEFIIKTLIDFIPQSDESCTNVSRLYYGTNKDVVIIDKEAAITLDDIVKIYKPPRIENREIKNKDFWDKVNSYDWLDILKRDYIIEHESATRADILICPICGHQHCFKYYKDTNSCYCFGQNGSVGGNYIDFLVATEKITLKEAIKKFKKEVLGEEETEISYQGTFDDLVKKDHQLVINQLQSLKLYTDHIIEMNWIDYKEDSNGNIKASVLCPMLYQFIKDNIYYLFVRDDAKSAINRYFYINGHYKLVSDDEIKGVIKNCIPLPYQRTKDINEVLNLLSTDLKFVPVDLLDADENIINFKNGILDLETMELKPHSPTILSSMQIPCNYYENVESPSTHYFDNYMNDLSNNDEDIKQLLLEYMGVGISNVPGYRMKQALFLIGDGNTGKSRLKILSTHLVGKDKTSNIDLRQLETQFGKSQLFNKRIVGTNDLSNFQIASLDTFKQATGGDYINVEFKFENSFDMQFKGVLWFCGNKLPYFSGDKGDWIYDRIIIVNCNNVIPLEKRDKFLDEHLWEERDYIMSLCIKALKKVIDNGYKYDIPESCKLANDEYKIENDSFLSFYKDCIVERDITKPINDNCTKGVIFAVYKLYCKNNNNGYFNSKKEVKHILEKLGKEEPVTANGGNIYYKYITLSDEAMIEYNIPLPKDKHFNLRMDDDYKFYMDEYKFPSEEEDGTCIE